MCGIFGIVSNRLESRNFLNSLDAITHRGPDSYGEYKDNNVYLGHRRLSIIDLEGGKQPFYSNDRNKIIIFNGEIYNYKEIKSRLESKGHRFSSNSDTETILIAYEEWGEDCVNYLHGMFAFAIWDNQDKSLFIARDRLGIKPLFYAIHNQELYFASEIKAIIADVNFPREIDEKSIASFFNFSYIPAPNTIFQRIKKLEPGFVLTWKNGEISQRKYWDLEFNSNEKFSEDYYISTLHNLLENSVSEHLVSDVPVGAFLSGGVDSSVIVALMAKLSPSRISTYCMGFGGETGGYLDERKYASEVASQFNTNHFNFEVKPKVDDILDSIVNSFDEPFADDSVIPTYFICKLAAADLKVTLSGLGGDELFAGYERYFGYYLQTFYSRVPSFIRNKIIHPLVEHIPERKDGHYTINHLKRFVRGGLLEQDKVYLSYISLLNEISPAQFFNDSSRFSKHHDQVVDDYLYHFNSKNITPGPGSSLNRALYSDIKVYLPDDILALSDRLSMHHSLEVRVPFLDHHLMEFAANIPPSLKLKNFNKKYLLKKAYRNTIPDSVIDHRKQGFVGPTTKWLNNDLREYVLNCLSKDNLDKHGYLNSNTVEKILSDHFSGKQIYDKLIWSMVMFQKWFNNYIA